MDGGSALLISYRMGTNYGLCMRVISLYTWNASPQGGKKEEEGGRNLSIRETASFITHICVIH